MPKSQIGMAAIGNRRAPAKSQTKPPLNFVEILEKVDIITEIAVIRIAAISKSPAGLDLKGFFGHLRATLLARDM